MPVRMHCKNEDSAEIRLVRPWRSVDRTTKVKGSNA